MHLLFTFYTVVLDCLCLRVYNFNFKDLGVQFTLTLNDAPKDVGHIVK